MGDWWYYVTTLPFYEIAARVESAAKFIQPAGFDELVQRELKPRYRRVSDYLLTEEQRFFNAIVVGVRGGEPRWYPLEVEPNPLEQIPGLDPRFEKSLGILELEGDEQLFAIDGQHRVEGIKEAVAHNASLAEDELTVLFVAAHSDQESVRRVRRIFSPLNGYAVPTQKGEIIAIDEDDPAAIVTRRIINEYEGFLRPTKALFDEDHVVWFGTRTEIPPDNDISVTSIVALYDSVAAICRSEINKRPRKIRKLRPPDEFLDSMLLKNIEFWDLLRSHVPAIDEVLNSSLEERMAVRHRSNSGGHFLFRPVGLVAFSRAVGLLEVRHGIPIRQSVEVLARMPMHLDQRPWHRLLWTQEEGMSSGRGPVAQALILYMVWAPPQTKNYDVTKRYQESVGDPTATIDDLRLEALV